MEDLVFEIDDSPSRKDINRLGNGLNEHAIESVGTRGFNAVAIWIRDTDGEILGGAQGLLNWNWLHVCLIWLDKPLRHRGIGSKLLADIEQIGRERGCQYAHLDTFSFQARAFYERYGYEVYGSLEDYPPGQTRYYMRKLL